MKYKGCKKLRRPTNQTSMAIKRIKNVPNMAAKPPAYLFLKKEKMPPKTLPNPITISRTKPGIK
jgi:hypothetical protein